MTAQQAWRGVQPIHGKGCANPAGHADHPMMLSALIGLPLVGRGPSYTFQHVISAMQGGGLEARMFAPLDRATGQPTVTGVPGLLARLPYNLVRKRALARIEDRFRNACARSAEPAFAYLWGNLSLDLAHELARQPKTIVVREKVNCAKQVARRIMEQAYVQLGAKAHIPALLSDAQIEKERAELGLADAVFCPSPMVRQSLLEIGVPQERLIEASYGFDPQRLAGVHKALQPIDGVTLLFAGSVCVRKGAHILLESWERANVKGRLVLIGDIEPLIASRYAHILTRPDVEAYGFQRDVGAYFRSADYFIFPTLEEGSPLVTYEAGSCGLPAITTAMGAGGFLRHGIDGTVVPTNNVDDWAEAIRAARPGSSEHQAQSSSVRQRALQFNWSDVGRQRREALMAIAAHNA